MRNLIIYLCFALISVSAFGQCTNTLSYDKNSGILSSTVGSMSDTTLIEIPLVPYVDSLYFISPDIFYMKDGNTYNLDLSTFLDDKIVSITGTGAVSITGTYPSFNVDVPIATAKNGLSVVGGDVELGGSLLHTTFIDDDGNGNSLLLGLNDKLDSFYLGTDGDQDYQTNNFSVNANSGISLNAIGAISTISDTDNTGLDPLTLSSGISKFYINTANRNNNLATNGQVLTLIDNSTGEAEWQNAGGSSVVSNNGLTTVNDTVKLGGLLIQDTYIDDDGAGRRLEIGTLTPIQSYKLTTVNNQDYTGDSMSIIGTGGGTFAVNEELQLASDTNIDGAGDLYINSNMAKIHIQTTNVNNSIAINGQVLTLVDGTSGIVEYKSVNAVQVISATSAISLDSPITKIIANNGATNITITLPAITPQINGFQINVTRAATSTGTITLVGSGAAQIQALAGTVGATTTIGAHSATGAGEDIQFTAVQSLNTWYR